MNTKRFPRAAVKSALGAVLALGLAAGAGLGGVPAADAQITINLYMCDGKAPTIIAAPGTSMINGTQGPDVILSLGGDRPILGDGGNDLICGSAYLDNIGAPAQLVGPRRSALLS